MEQRLWPRSPDELNEHIQVRVPSVDHIFNPMDPTPLPERSLNPEVADWIEEWAEDLDHDQPLLVEFHVGDGRLLDRTDAVVAGLHHHFEYREWQAGRQLSKLMREGRISLAIGLSTLLVFNAASRLIGQTSHPVVGTLHDGLTVIGWVAMWKPTEIFLFEWWPIRRERRACRRLAEAEVRFHVRPSA